MNKTPEHLVTVDLTKYKEQILAEEDKLLFEEVGKCAQIGAFRAAYIMIWIACAESFKRRFKEASKRDGNAGIIVGEIKKLEKEYKPIDSLVLDEAQKYGFISASTYEKLNNIKKFRCVYAHPYEEAPSEEELLSSVSIVVEKVLSQPVKLKEGFINSQIDEMLNNPHLLDDIEERVIKYANGILPRISEDYYQYMLDKIWAQIDKTIADPSLGIFTRRGTWFSSILVEVLIDKFSTEQWHSYISKYPNIAPYVLSNKSFFGKIGELAQDSVVGNILDASLNSPSVLTYLEELWESGSLSKRQSDRFLEIIDKFNQQYYNRESAKCLSTSGLKISTCFDSIISHLKEHNWYTQNPVVSFISNQGPIEIEKIDSEKQVVLGRNILQAADGSAGNANILLNRIITDEELWPIEFVFGILIECFVNENNEFRFKISKLNKVCEIINKYEDFERDSMFDKTMKDIEESTFKPRIFIDISDISRENDECCSVLEKYPWGDSFCQQIKKSLASKSLDKQELE